YPGAEIDDIGGEFHLEIFAAAGNAMLLEVFRPLRTRFQLAFGLPRHHDPAGMRSSLGDHLLILEAIERRDGTGAQHAMLAHLEQGLEVRRRISQSLANKTINKGEDG